MNARDAARFQAALDSENAETQLYELAEQMKRENLSQVEIYCRFVERLESAPYEDDDTRDYDALADTMDCIIGFCAMNAALFSHYLTGEEIDEHRKSRRANLRGDPREKARAQK